MGGLRARTLRPPGYPWRQATYNGCCLGSLPGFETLQCLSYLRRVSDSGTPCLIWLVGAVLCAVVLRASANADERGGWTQEATVRAEDGLQAAHRLLAQDRLLEAENAVRSYLTEHNTSADGHFLLGLVLFQKIRREATERVASAGDNGATSERSAQKSREENAKASLAEYTEGAKYRKPNASDLKIVALDYVFLERYADASKWLEHSVDEDPNDAEAWYFLGRAKYNENRFADAITAFERCLALEPRNIKAQSNLGLSYAGLNRVVEAQAAFLKAIEWQSDAPHKDPEAYIGLGDLFIQQNRASEAVPYLLQAVEIAPRESRAREKLGSAYLNLDQLAAAQIQVQSAVTLNPRNPSLHYLLGSIYRKQGQHEKAKAEFEQFQTLKQATETARP
jgi:Flp pilus assembly protein TadD